jgi:sigma-E factor negative regulatory protein RseB
MRSLVRLLVWGVVAVLPVSFAHAGGCQGADDDALEWLGKMSRSIHQVSYTGVVTLQREDDMQVMQISHLVGQSASSERLTRLTGQGAQVVRGEHPLDCVHPGHRLLLVSEDLQSGRCGIAQQYQFSVVGGERIAGRKAVRIKIEPRDVYRYGYVMSLDRETGLLLKTEMVGHGELTLEKFQFANLSYTPDELRATEADTVHQAQHPDAVLDTADVESGQTWSVGWVPRGFIATDRPSVGSGRRSYTDGLAVFSVFLEDLDNEIRPGEGIVQSGGTLSYSRGMQLTGEPVLVTVIGEVPVNTARMVADSVRREQ